MPKLSMWTPFSSSSCKGAKPLLSVFVRNFVPKVSMTLFCEFHMHLSIGHLELARVLRELWTHKIHSSGVMSVRDLTPPPYGVGGQETCQQAMCKTLSPPNRIRATPKQRTPRQSKVMTKTYTCTSRLNCVQFVHWRVRCR